MITSWADEEDKANAKYDAIRGKSKQNTGGNNNNNNGNQGGRSNNYNEVLPLVGYRSKTPTPYSCLKVGAHPRHEAKGLQ
jgi:hypothetical protein